MKITKPQALILGEKFDINFKIVNFDEWHYGLNVELEHSNITRNNLTITAKIAIAHLMEFPDYYKRLKSMENKAEKYWKGKNKDIFL